MTRLALAGLALFAAACAPTLQLPGTAQIEPALEDDRFLASDGARLPYRAWLPETPAWAAIVALHGFNDYRNAFDEPASEWARRGIATYAYDQRGFGETEHRGTWPGTRLLVRDAIEFTRLVRARHRAMPVFLLGESMGGAAAVVAMAEDTPPPVDGAILVAPAVWDRVSMSAAQRTTLDALAHLAPWFPVGGGNTGRVASDNTEMLRGLGRDPLVQKYNRIDAVYGLVDLMDEAQAAPARLSAPALILFGDNEQLIPRGPVARFLAKLPTEAAPRQRLALYPKGYHMLLRDLGAEAVRADIAAWMADRAAPLPSGAERTIADIAHGARDGAN